MGFFDWLAGAPKKSAEVLEAESMLSQSELKVLQDEFKAIAGTRVALQVEDAVRLMGLAEPHNSELARLLAKAISKERPAEGLTIGDYIVAKGKSRGGESSVQEYFFQLLVLPGQDSLSRDTLVTVIKGCLAFVLHENSQPPGLAESLADGMLQVGQGGLPLKGWKAFCKQTPLASTALRCILGPASSPHHRDELLQLPQLDFGAVGEDFCGSPNCQMSKARAAVLSSGMSMKQRQKWELLFHSDKHGKSFNTFMSLAGGKGSTLVFVSDNHGNVFGGFASQPWAKAGTFTGDFSCFVFTMAPSVAIYRACGVNENFQWCGQGFNALPNGFGFGGQTGYFAVYVDDTMDKGMTRAAATYNNPAFANEQVFEVKSVECWLVEPSEEELELREKRGTVMDRFKETNRFLEIAGATANNSAAYRQDGPIEEEDNTSKFR